MVGASSNIKHKAHLRLEILADSLEEPLVRIDFTIVTVLYTEAKMDTPSFEHVLAKTHIPSRHLEDMQKVVRDILIGDTLVHDIPQGLHFKFTGAVISRCKALGL